MSDDKKRDYSRLIFPPDAVGALGTEYIRQRRDNREFGIRLGLKSLDEENERGESFLPVLPGEVVSILGRPGNGKTGFMVHWARHRAAWLRSKGLANKRAVLYLTCEQTIEELQTFRVAAKKGVSITAMAKGILTPAQWKSVLEEGLETRYDPLWFAGYSFFQPSGERITIDSIRAIIERMSEKTTIDFVLLDYLQRLPYRRGVESKTIGVSDNLDELAGMALQYGLPMAIAVQAKREVDDYDVQIPALDDGQWTSSIEQTSSKVLALARPRKYRKEGEEFGNIVVRGTKQMVIAVHKQKLGHDNFVRYAEFDPAYNLLDDLEEKRQIVLT
ncbi:MAG: hypothetical protein M0R06_06330 [Sphaerochaeta sp.]|jgi:replicative DNA helicase|nr:hypothetical protein [Sphaerochaeta sp.]